MCLLCLAGNVSVASWHSPPAKLTLPPAVEEVPAVEKKPDNEGKAFGVGPARTH